MLSPSCIESFCAWAHFLTRMTQRNFLSLEFCALHVSSSPMSQRTLPRVILFLSLYFKAWHVLTQTKPKTIRTQSQEMRTMTTIWKKLFLWLRTGFGTLIIPVSGCLGWRTPLLHISLHPGRRILINQSQLWNSGLFYVLWYSWTCIIAIWRPEILHHCIFR